MALGSLICLHWVLALKIWMKVRLWIHTCKEFVQCLFEDSIPRTLKGFCSGIRWSWWRATDGGCCCRDFVDSSWDRDGKTFLKKPHFQLDRMGANRQRAQKLEGKSYFEYTFVLSSQPNLGEFNTFIYTVMCKNKRGQTCGDDMSFEWSRCWPRVMFESRSWIRVYWNKISNFMQDLPQLKRQFNL